MEKSCSRKQGHSPTRAVHMRKRVDPFTQANNALACSGRLALTGLIRPGGPKLGESSHYRTKKSEFLTKVTFCISCKRLANFVRK